MKLIEIYYENKKKYSEYTLIFKVGKFYTVYHEDYLILNLLTGYKINDFNNQKKLGFPVHILEKILNKLDEKN